MNNPLFLHRMFFFLASGAKDGWAGSLATSKFAGTETV
jgi:hypothetical protein